MESKRQRFYSLWRLFINLIHSHSKGIGFETVSQLLRAHAKVYLAARNEERAKAAIESLHNAGLGKGGDHSLGEVAWLKLDLSDPRLAKEAAEDFLKRETRLDILGELTNQLE